MYWICSRTWIWKFDYWQSIRLQSNLPKRSFKGRRPPLAKETSEFLRKAHRQCDQVITAWGVSQVVNKLNPEKTLKTLKKWETYSLGHCKDGTPRHPLYLRKGTPRVS